jgi:hypothetical protein
LRFNGNLKKLAPCLNNIYNNITPEVKRNSTARPSKKITPSLQTKKLEFLTPPPLTKTKSITITPITPYENPGPRKRD